VKLLVLLQPSVEHPAVLLPSNTFACHEALRFEPSLELMLPTLLQETCRPLLALSRLSLLPLLPIVRASCLRDPVTLLCLLQSPLYHSLQSCRCSLLSLGTLPAWLMLSSCCRVSICDFSLAASKLLMLAATKPLAAAWLCSWMRS
jgi:hypothetical protein